MENIDKWSQPGNEWLTMNQRLLKVSICTQIAEVSFPCLKDTEV